EMDAYIQKKEGMSVKDIFAVHGEEYFRNCESNTLISLQEKRHVVVSCGGGVPLRERNVELMKKGGYVVWLTATPEAIFDRVKDSTERPLLNGNMRVDFIRDLMESRREKYEAAADICIDTTEKDIVEICEEMLQKLSLLQRNKRNNETNNFNF
ncbi:MAG: shikimate kinase, partial [Anaerotignum sp.]|nr:shikimate kinase [Anaerotignum sp.]